MSHLAFLSTFKGKKVSHSKGHYLSLALTCSSRWALFRQLWVILSSRTTRWYFLEANQDNFWFHHFCHRSVSEGPAVGSEFSREQMVSQRSEELPASTGAADKICTVGPNDGKSPRGRHSPHSLTTAARCRCIFCESSGGTALLLAP